MGRKTDDVCVEVPNVAPCHAGVRDDLRCADSTLHWEFLVVLAWVTVIVGMELGFVELIGFGGVKRNVSSNILLRLCQNLAAEKRGKLRGVSEA